MGFLKQRIEFILLMFRRRNIKELLGKNIEIIYGYPLYLFSFLTPRNKNKWVIGSHIGFSGNSKFLFIELIEKHKKSNCYWIASNKKEKKYIKELGLPVVLRWSIKGLFHCLTAKVYIFCFHLIDINFWTSGNAKRVNIWHGVGIKNIEFKSTKGSAGKIYNERNVISRIYFPYLFKRPHLFLSTSPLMTKHFCECFRITDNECIEDQYPRCKIFNLNKDQIFEFINKYETVESLKLVEKISQHRKSYLYMPTWRETRQDFIKEAGFNFQTLNSVLKLRNELFLLKLHPECDLSISELKGLDHVIILDRRIDIYPILPFTDVLITDYSSIYYDYLLLKDKDILLFPFDYSDYISQGRDLAFDFDEYTPGKRVNSFNELLTFIENGTDLSFVEREWITNQFWNYGNCKTNLYEGILDIAIS